VRFRSALLCQQCQNMYVVEAKKQQTSSAQLYQRSTGLSVLVETQSSFETRCGPRQLRPLTHCYTRPAPPAQSFLILAAIRKRQSRCRNSTTAQSAFPETISYLLMWRGGCFAVYSRVVSHDTLLPVPTSTLSEEFARSHMSHVVWKRAMAGRVVSACDPGFT